MAKFTECDEHDVSVSGSPDCAFNSFKKLAEIEGVKEDQARICAVKTLGSLKFRPSCMIGMADGTAPSRD